MTYDNIDFQFNFLGFVQTEKLQSCRDTAHTSSSYPKKNAPNWNSEHENIRHRIGMSFALKSFSLPPKAFPTTSSPRVWIRHARSSVSGDNASIVNVYQGWTNNPGAAGRPFFPPSVAVEIKALACQLPRERNLPLSRLSLSDIRGEVINQGIVASISETTLWRWLSQDAIQPWRHRSWLFPRDPSFAEKAGPILDLYAGSWAATPLRPDEFVISADEKTSIQARQPEHSTLPPQSRRPMRVQHDYKRLGAWAYLAAWDVHRAKVFGRCESANGNDPFDRLVDQVMYQEPYCSASRVFWIVDNCSSHRGLKAAKRLRDRWPAIVLVHTPVHASWLNQIEIYFSIVQRKVLTPNDFDSLAALEDRLLRFQDHYQRIAQPFQWRFTRDDLANLLVKIESPFGKAAA